MAHPLRNFVFRTLSAARGCGYAVAVIQSLLARYPITATLLRLRSALLMPGAGLDLAVEDLRVGGPFDMQDTDQTALRA